MPDLALFCATFVTEAVALRARPEGQTLDPRYRRTSRLPGVDAEIRPEPSVEEREAILAALERVIPARPDPRGGWWRLGVEDDTDDAPGSWDPRSERA
jgi:hypothetical protein